MKFRFSFLPLFAGSMLMISGCGILGGGGSSDKSPTTGWQYNNYNNGGFEVKTNYQQEAGPGLVFVEGGTFTMGRVEQDVMYDWNNMPRRVTVASFYMDQTEVRNVDYREYLHWIRRVLVSYPQVYRNALPDTLCWRTKMGFNDPYVETYFRHPAYNDYPVVGVNWLQAGDYCLWRTDRVNEQLLVDAGILEFSLDQKDADNFNTEAYLAGLYVGTVKRNLPSLDPSAKEGRPVTFEDGILLPKYRLPTEAEWEYAALGLIGNTYEERITDRKLYPWNGHNVRNSDVKYRGQMMANFRRGRGDYMGTAGALNDNASIPAPVKSYWPNDFGLYNMAGNVNEWVLDVYRPLSFQDVDEFRPFRGNVFKEVKRDEEGRIVEKDSLGRLIYQDVKPEEVAGRTNYNKADYRNYLDGDLASSIDYESINDMDKPEDPGSNRMYYQGTDRSKLKPNDGMTSLINDHVRVYKGGSWKDRAYWLIPGTRRYLNEKSSRDDLGFRCAMEHVGSPSGKGGKRK